jgi:hypothetical protein
MMARFQRGTKEENMKRYLGILAALVAIGILIELPEIRRYIRISTM